VDLLGTSLTYFLEVARVGSIAEASAALRITPSAISRQIAKLEHDLGHPLFEREPRGMRLTEAGSLLVTMAQRWRTEQLHTEAEIQALRHPGTSTIRLATTEGFALDLLPEVVADYQSARPGIRFQILVGSAAEATGMVRTGQADLALTFTVAPERDIHVEYSAPCPVYALVREDHPLAGRSSVELAELVPYPLALMDTDTTLRQLFDICCSLEKLVFTPALLSNRACTLHSYVARSHAVTLAGELTASAQLHAPGLVGVLIRNPTMRRRVVQVQSLAGRQLSEPISLFVEYLERRLSAADADPG
jgi:DNA-binding transcriptional LysR family regulator